MLRRTQQKEVKTLTRTTFLFTKTKKKKIRYTKHWLERRKKVENGEKKDKAATKHKPYRILIGLVYGKLMLISLSKHSFTLCNFKNLNKIC